MDEVMNGKVSLPPYPHGLHQLPDSGIIGTLTLERVTYDPDADFCVGTLILGFADREEEHVLSYRHPIGQLYFGFLSSGWGFDPLDPKGAEMEVLALLGIVERYRTFIMDTEILPTLLEEAVA